MHTRHTRFRIGPKYLETVTVKIASHEVDYFLCCLYSAPKPSHCQILPQLKIDLIDSGGEKIPIVRNLNVEAPKSKQTDYSETLLVEKFFENIFLQVISTKSRLLDDILTNNTNPVLKPCVDNSVGTIYKCNQMPYRAKFSVQSWYRAEFKRKKALKNDFTVFLTQELIGSLYLNTTKKNILSHITSARLI